jgi:hypothetical protein
MIPVQTLKTKRNELPDSQYIAVASGQCTKLIKLQNVTPKFSDHILYCVKYKMSLFYIRLFEILKLKKLNILHK